MSGISSTRVACFEFTAVIQITKILSIFRRLIRGAKVVPFRRTSLAVLLPALFWASPGLWAQESKPVVEKARQLYWSRKFAEAVPHYSLHFEQYPDDIPSAVEYGYCLLLSGRKEKAWQILGGAVDSGHAGLDAEATWIDLSLQLGRSADALPLCVRLRGQYPEDRAIARMEARLLEATGDLKGSARAWSEIVRRWPGETAALRPLGRLLSWSGDFEGAEAALRRFLAAHPGDLEGKRLLVEVMGWGWKWDDAGRLLDEALVAHPGDPELLRLAAEEREYFAPKLVIRPSWWKDSDDLVRVGVATELQAVIHHRLILQAREAWTRFHQRDPGYPIIRRWSTSLGLGWMGPDKFQVKGSYTRHEGKEIGQSSAFDLEARHALFSGVSAMASAGRDDVTEKAFALMEKVNVKYASLAVFSEAEALPWSLGVSVSDYSDGPERLSLQSHIEVPLFTGLSGIWKNWTFWQRERSYLYFGPRRYSEHELLIAVRPFKKTAFILVECRAGGQWAQGDGKYGFRDSGDLGFVGEISLEHHTPGAVRLGVRARIDRLDTDNPYSGYGAEAWLELRF